MVVNGSYYALEEYDCAAVVTRASLGGSQVCYFPPLIRPNQDLTEWLGQFSLGNSSTALSWLNAVANATSSFKNALGAPLFSRELYQDIGANPSDEYLCTLGVTPQLSLSVPLVTGSAVALVGRVIDPSVADSMRRYLTFNITSVRRLKVFQGMCSLAFTFVSLIGIACGGTSRGCYSCDHFRSVAYVPVARHRFRRGSIFCAVHTVIGNRAIHPCQRAPTSSPCQGD